MKRTAHAFLGLKAQGLPGAHYCYHASMPDENGLKKVVLKFFARLDSRRLDELPDLFEKDCAIVHFDGVITSGEEFIREMRADPTPPSAKRELTGFSSGGEGDWGWISYLNKNRIGSRVMTFAETAILKRRGGRWRFARVHYSILR